MNLLSILLMGTPKQGENPLISFVPLILVIVVFYFFMIRPQMKKQKEVRQFREELKTGDKVITIGGIYGKIVDIKDEAIILEVENKVRFKVAKSGIVKDESGIIAQR